jgi:hypothetical protein
MIDFANFQDFFTGGLYSFLNIFNGILNTVKISGKFNKEKIFSVFKFMVIFNFSGAYENGFISFKEFI